MLFKLLLLVYVPAIFTFESFRIDTAAQNLGLPGICSSPSFTDNEIIIDVANRVQYTVCCCQYYQTENKYNSQKDIESTLP